jgi:hypothetical protein
MVNDIGFGVEKFLDSFVTISFNNFFPELFGETLSRCFKLFAVIFGIGITTHRRVFHHLTLILAIITFLLISLIDHHAFNLPEKLALKSFVSMFYQVLFGVNQELYDFE